MALKKTNATPAAAPAAEYENPDAEAATTAEAETKPTAAERVAAAQAQHAAEQAAAAPSTSTAVTTKAAGAVVRHQPMADPLKDLEGAFPVTFDSVRNLIITNGNVMDRQSNNALGSEIVLELMSFQKQFVCSPGVDGDEGKEYVKYSDDGITTNDGMNCQEYIKHLQQTDFPEAKMSERLVIVGGLSNPGSMPELKDTIVQISLPPTSRGAFTQYRIDTAYKVKKGLATPDGSELVRIKCKLQTKGKMTWTVAEFSRAG